MEPSSERDLISSRRDYLKSSASVLGAAALQPVLRADRLAPVNVHEMPGIDLAIASICVDGFALRIHPSPICRVSSSIPSLGN